MYSIKMHVPTIFVICRCEILVIRCISFSNEADEVELTKLPQSHKS